MSTDKSGEISASEGSEHWARLDAPGDSRKRLSTDQLVVLAGVVLLGAGVLGAGALGAEAPPDSDDVVLVELDDELEPPVFDFLSRESLR